MQRKLQIDLHNECNLNCEFCYNWKFVKSSELRQYSFEEVLKLGGTRNLIYLGGGEPAIYPDIERLVEELINRKNKVILSTNGTVFKHFKKSDCFQLQVNIPSGNRECYKEITGEDLFNQVKDNLCKYAEYLERKVFVKMPVYARNFNDIDDIYDLCKEINLQLVAALVFRNNNCNIKTIDPDIFRKKMLDLKLRQRGDLSYIVGSIDPREICGLEYYSLKD